MSKQVKKTETRSVRAIAIDIIAHWPKPNYAAVPYLKAMEEITDIKGYYYMDRADSIVRYFLSNAGSWRGEHARRIKAELKAMLKEVR